MLKKLADYLFKATGVSINHEHLAGSNTLCPTVTYLLVKLGQSDGDFSPEETAAILKFLTTQAGMTSEKALASIEQAFSRDSEAELESTLAALRNDLSLAQKGELLVLLYRALRADGAKLAAEQDFIAKVVKALGISEDLHADCYAEVQKA